MQAIVTVRQEETINISLQQYEDFIRAKERLNLLEKAVGSMPSYSDIGEVKRIFGLGEKSNDKDC